MAQSILRKPGTGRVQPPPPPLVNNSPPIFRRPLPPVVVPSAQTDINLSNPQAPTTSRPLHLLGLDIAARHALVYPRKPDNGANRPILGVPVKNPNGLIGGRPSPLRPLLDGNELAPMTVGSVTQGMRVQDALKKVLATRRLGQKLVLPQIVPGPSGLTFARAPRIIPTPGPSGVRVVERGARRDVRPMLSRGTLAGHTTAPASTLRSMVQGRIALADEPIPMTIGQANQQANDGNVGGLSEDIRRAGAVSPTIADSPFALQEPEMGPGGAAANADAEQDGTERLIFLGGALFVAWLLFKGGR